MLRGNHAETATILPIIKAFQKRHSLAGMVVVADAGMLSAGNLRELDEAALRFIVGSRAAKALTRSGVPFPLARRRVQ
jgi:transposase